MPSGQAFTFEAGGSSSSAAAPSRASGSSIGSISVARPDATTTSYTCIASPWVPFAPAGCLPSAGWPDT
jgi:hypothetical protein